MPATSATPANLTTSAKPADPSIRGPKKRNETTPAATSTSVSPPPCILKALLGYNSKGHTWWELK
ncbi:MAG: hypothetical protein M1826_000110 [Phylliscum demangeonii]|nr:MAG: hypothetical protein M1826_000110 [Phylliscum demangeonii]